MTIPALVDWFHKDYNWEAFAISAVITIFIGLLFTLANRPHGRISLTIRETFILTAATWLVVCGFAAIPFILSNKTCTYTDSFFEAISGLTTTGASIITGIDFISPGLLLWRALLEWLGGIGIIVMAFTVMPLLKIGGMQLFRSEFSDRSEKILPRASQIAGAIVLVYTFLTFLCIGFLYIGGMTFLEAVCHGFATLSTGGFSTSDASIAYFKSPLIESILCIFMLIGSTTLILFVKAFQGRPLSIFQDSQVRTFLSVVLFFIILMTSWQWHQGETLLHAFRQASFNVISAISTTGFTSTDYSTWGTFPLIAILLMMMIGGCTGSTAGGIKILRYQIMFSVAKSNIYQLRRPHGVFIPLYNKKPIPPEVFTSVFTFFGLYILSFAILSLGLGFYNLDLVTTLTAAVSALNNTGTGLGALIGPSGSFAPLPDGAKWLLMGGMLLGRLEYITFLILLVPSFWRD